MNIKKGRLVHLIFILLLSIALVGCSSNENSSGDSKDDITTITFWHGTTDIAAEGTEAVVKAFEEKNPNIKVNSVFTANQGSGTNEKLLTAIASNNPPDVAYFGRFEIASWAAQDSLEDLTELAANDGITKDNYYHFAWEEASFGGKLYGLPTTTDSRLVYYNKDHFNEVGLDPENPPKSIDELEAAAEKLTIKDGNRLKRIGFIPWYAEGWLYGWGWSFGGEFYDPETNTATANDLKVVEALQWMTDYANKYNIEDISSFTDSQGSGAMDPFLTDQLSMMVSGPWNVSAIKKFNPDLNYGVFPMPTPTGTDHTTWSGGFSVIMPKGVKNKDAAWEFMKFFGGEEGQKIFSGIVRDFSVIDSVNEELGFKDDPILKEFVNILPNSHTRPSMTEGSLYWTELQSATDNAIRGNGTPKENLDKVTKALNNALKE